MANGLMAAGYAFLFWLIYRDPLRKDLPFFLFACAFATVYNVAYDTAAWLRWLTTLALLVRLLPPIEACWCVIEHRRTYRIAFIFMTASFSVGILNPVVLGYGYLTVRNLATLSVTLACVGVAVMNWYAPMANSRLLSIHLTLQAVWMSLHSLFSLTAQWYLNSNLPAQHRRKIADWTWVLISTLIVLAYRHYFIYQSAPVEPAAERAAAADRWLD